jgi:SHS2 domain-containing protein
LSIRKKYRLIDHTADLGIHVFGKDPDELFDTAARAMFDQITNIKALKGIEQQSIKVKGADWPDLMVNWLRELLYLWTVKELLVKTVEILSLSETELSAVVKADPYDPENHIIKAEIKAVTYHQSSVESGLTGWESKIIFDV